MLKAVVIVVLFFAVAIISQLGSFDFIFFAIDPPISPSPINPICLNFIDKILRGNKYTGHFTTFYRQLKVLTNKFKIIMCEMHKSVVIHMKN